LTTSQPRFCYFDGVTPLDVVVTGAGAAGTGTDAAAAAKTFIAMRGKLKLPPASSITLTWQIYVPGFNCVSGTSNWNDTASRSGTFRLSAERIEHSSEKPPRRVTLKKGPLR
jgi:hypothetical protein